MPWINNEAKALKDKLSGITVTDVAYNGREIDVWFRNPENELRNMTYPAIVIEHAGLNKAPEREHRGATLLSYIPEEYQPGPYPSVDTDTGDSVTFDPGAVAGLDYLPGQSPFKVQDFPIPYNLDFTITVYARLQTELMPIVNSLSKIDRIPVRFGYLEVPEDGTIRSLDLMAGPEFVGGRDAEDRRLFQAVYSVRVFTELNLYDVTRIGLRVSDIETVLVQIPAASGWGVIRPD